MKKTPLVEYLALPGNSQSKLALRVGLTQGAISKMVRTGRKVDVVEHDNGGVELEEKRVINSASTAA